MSKVKGSDIMGDKNPKQLKKKKKVVEKAAVQPSAGAGMGTFSKPKK
jgi:hypothetical protein